MNISCFGFHNCHRKTGWFECDISDGNYFFQQADIFIINFRESTDIDDYNSLFKNFEFISETNGERIVIPIDKVSFARKANDFTCRDTEYWLWTKISRPEELF